MEKNCQRCGQAFQCNVNDISSCGCYGITLSEAQQQKISEKYDDCICPECLRYYSTIETPKHIALAEQIQKAETHIFKAVFPNTTNHYDTLFGGTAMQMMDEVAFICATRFSRKRMVTVSTDKIDFEKPIPAGTIIELIGKVSSVGNTSLKIQVEIYIEEMYSFSREKAITGMFTFVAVDEHKKPVSVV
jgi:acyl-CoA hydrolase